MIGQALALFPGLYFNGGERAANFLGFNYADCRTIDIREIVREPVAFFSGFSQMATRWAAVRSVCSRARADRGSGAARQEAAEIRHRQAEASEPAHADRRP
jgi:hypothetical protein